MDTREDARARLTSALTDFELVVEGGASNKGFLLDVLADPAFRAGAVDTGWLDRFNAARATWEAYAVEGLIAAAILAYQRTRAATRLNFFADTTTVMPVARAAVARTADHVDLPRRDLSAGGVAIGAWRYRVQLGEQTASVTLRETGKPCGAPADQRSRSCACSTRRRRSRPPDRGRGPAAAPGVGFGGRGARQLAGDGRCRRRADR
jgi:acetyl/propionyl-CoA carboxylase alpha subunit